MPAPTQFHARLSGKVAIVTGAGGEDHPDGDGIGKAIAMLLAAEGARTCVVDLDGDRARHTVDRIERAGGTAFAEVGDISRDDRCGEIVQAVRQRFGRIDILVNNVGIRGGAARIEALDDAVWQRVMDVNLKSAMLMMRHAIGAMVDQRAGAIVNISSIGGLLSHGSGFVYGPSKAALIALTREMAVAYGRDGIRANCICPGHMFTPMVTEVDAKTRERRRKVAPLGIEGDAWDIAQATLFLASDEARFITGLCMPIDGGVTATAPLKAIDLVED